MLSYLERMMAVLRLFSESSMLKKLYKCKKAIENKLMYNSCISPSCGYACRQSCTVYLRVLNIMSLHEIMKCTSLNKQEVSYISCASFSFESSQLMPGMPFFYMLKRTEFPDGSARASDIAAIPFFSSRNPLSCCFV